MNAKSAGFPFVLLAAVLVVADFRTLLGDPAIPATAIARR